MWRMRHSCVSQANTTRLGLPRDEPLPRLCALPHDIHRVLPVLALSAESELVLRLSVGNLVDPEPFV